MKLRKYKLGCNWSLALKKLIIQNRINVDYIKAGEQKEFLEMVSEMRMLRPVLLHGGLGYSVRTGISDVKKINFMHLNKLITYCGTPQYGIHIALSQKEKDELKTDEKIYLHMSSVVKYIKENLKVPLLLENTPDCSVDRRFYKFVPYVLPEQINRLLVDNDVSLLLDITHAKITAKYHGWDIYGYLESLLLDRVKEIHINGCGNSKEELLMDSHQKMDEEDFDLLEWVLCRTNPNIISLEYSGKKYEDINMVEKNICKFFNFFDNSITKKIV